MRQRELYASKSPIATQSSATANVRNGLIADSRLIDSQYAQEPARGPAEPHSLLRPPSMPPGPVTGSLWRT